MKTIILSAGHTKGTGARAYDGTDEWSWCMLSVEACKKELESLGYKVIVLFRDVKLGYTSAMRKLARRMRSEKAACCAEFHFNKAGANSANGFEILHWWGSSKSKHLARCVADRFSKYFTSITPRGDRGVRSLWFHRWNKDKAYSGRGGAYCFLTPCPAILCEPGFASNRSDWGQLVSNADKVGVAYALGMDDFLKAA